MVNGNISGFHKAHDNWKSYASVTFDKLEIAYISMEGEYIDEYKSTDNHFRIIFESGRQYKKPLLTRYRYTTVLESALKTFMIVKLFP